MSPSKTNQRIIDTLTVVKQTLDTAQGPLSLAPIPGLSSAASVLSTLAGMILAAEGNKRTREELASHIQELTSIIGSTAKKAESVSRTDEMTTYLANSPELKERVATLEKDLKYLTSEARGLETGLFGLLLSKRNTDILLGIKTGIDDATRKFQIQGGITVEMLINGIVANIEQIKQMQQQQHKERQRFLQQERDERALKDLPRVNAGYSSASNPTKSGTLEGTRTALLEEIIEWSDSGDDGTFMYILSGGAGTGKSTIAYETSHRLEKKGALGASFFFVRDASAFNTTTYLLATMAYQLAHYQTSLYPHIAKAAQEYVRAGKQAEQLQMDLESLIIKPLMNVEASHHPITLVLDAVDECTPAAQDEVIRLLLLLMERIPKIPFPVRIFVTTRPEVKIETGLNTEKLRNVSKPYKLHDIPRRIVDGDIKIFFDVRLRDLSCWETVLNSRTGIVKDLTNLAAGLFIYADTVVKFLGRNPHHVPEILDALLSDNPSDGSFTLKNLDRLYVVVLRNALNDDNLDIPGVKKYIKVVLGSLALLQDQISTSDLNDLIDVPMRFIRDILDRLGSVILKPEADDVEIRMLHASFPQFLIDIERCTDPKFHINPSEHHQRLALTCLQVMSTKHMLKRNICEFGDPIVMKSGTPGLQNTVKKCIPPSLRSRSGYFGLMMEFARTKLLVWVEVLSYINRLEVAVPALLAALSWCSVHIQDGNRNEIIQLINDTHWLVLQSYVHIDACPEHLYLSAFPLAPSCALTSQYNEFLNTPTGNHTIIKSMMPRDSTWGACLYTIPIDATACRAMFSPDGKLIASGSLDGEVGLWDATIGSLKRSVTGHVASVLCVAWAPDGESVASGSSDGTIRVWNATSGAQVHVQRVQNTECRVYAIVWSRDGTQFATSAKPGGVQVWDIVIGKELKERMVIPAIETVLTISKDLGRVMEQKVEGNLRVWDLGCDNGKILKELSQVSTVKSAVFLYDDTQVSFYVYNEGIQVWDLESGGCTRKVKMRGFVRDIILSQSGTILASSTRTGTHLFNTKSWDLLGSFEGSFSSVSFSPEDRHVLTSSDTIQMWDASAVLAPKPRIKSFTPSIVKHESRIHFVAISLDGSRVAAMSDEAVSIWSLKSVSLLCIIDIHGDEFKSSIDLSPNGQKIAILDLNGTAIWDVATTQPTLVQRISSNPGIKLAWSPDGHWIASAVTDPDDTPGLSVFDAVTGELVKHLTLSTRWYDFSDLEFSNDNTMLYVNDWTDEEIFRWKEGEKVELEHHRWETEKIRRSRLHKNGWIVRERDGKRLCWVQDVNKYQIARWGNYYAVGRESGKLDILHIEESPMNTAKSL